MARWMALGALPMFLVAHAAGQTYLFALRGNGDLLRIDPQTGVASLVGSSGVACEAGAAYAQPFGRSGALHDLRIAGGPGASADRVTVLYPWTGGGAGAVAPRGGP